MIKMADEKKFMELLMDKAGFPIESREPLLRDYDYLIGRPECAALFQRAKELYFQPIDQGETEKLLEEAAKITKPVGIDLRTVQFLFLLHCSEDLYRLYLEKGLDETMFWDLSVDFRCKLIECHSLYGIWGTTVFWWFHRHFLVDRFALGRFQYESANFDGFEGAEGRKYVCGDIVISPGERVYNFHIPSCGPIPKDVRMDSYKRAFDFFGGAQKGYIPLVCHSWLIYPKYRDVFPSGSNIRSFYDDFDIINSGETDRFYDLPRVFNMSCDTDPSKLPCDTSLRRAFVDYLKKGGSAGWGYGIIIFDGEKIINKKGE